MGVPYVFDVLVKTATEFKRLRTRYCYFPQPVFVSYAFVLNIPFNVALSERLSIIVYRTNAVDFTQLL